MDSSLSWFLVSEFVSVSVCVITTASSFIYIFVILTTLSHPYPCHLFVPPSLMPHIPVPHPSSSALPLTPRSGEQNGNRRFFCELEGDGRVNTLVSTGTIMCDFKSGWMNPDLPSLGNTRQNPCLCGLLVRNVADDPPPAPQEGQKT